MRLVSYNILDGGEGRADPLAEVLEAQRPDIVALVEADVPATVERIARRLKMDFVIGEGQGHSSALLSRYPIQQSINHAGLNSKISRSFLEASVQLPGGVELPVGVLHLPAGATDPEETARMHQLEIILDLFGKYRKASQPHILVGDFNSNAPYQHIDPANCKAKTQQAWKANGLRLPRRVIETIIHAGYADTYATQHNEQYEMIGSFDTQHPGQRVDYIFSFGIATTNIKDAWVEQDRLAKYASDHFPVGVEIAD
jgi:endonuclease/exonuclease/phosphatase family metal-dependent hydrolase